MNHDAFIVPPNSKISLQKDYDTAYKVDNYQKIDAASKLQTNIQQIANYQNILYAQNTYALLIIFQAMDAAGKDSTIKHVMSGVNPQGFQVFNFQAPSTEELDHDYLWRTTRALPERGRIGIFNRSYYEEVLVVRVHPEILLKQQLPHFPKENEIWQQRFEEINNFEKYLVNNGVIILKFFLNLSKSEQKKRFLKRIDTPEKHWKFAASDVYARSSWDDYMEAYEAVFNHTSTEWAPWYIIPADRKWFTRLVVADIICTKLAELNLKYPTVSDEHRQQLLQAKYMLEQED
ncbi:polyphosphate kinase 2 family protein [Nostocaceae cyanobacterium CENA357]|uniref:Polyphosphate kinase 2 family protein n=1 Tax=Atlanticothrix silvestris CENA357 TaxID=1725252 RepID=A0A8J7L5J0_9CYAN|nr:polyphosphate kinase 2 family protein [Atlanticothrix silvestris]MBH8554717.1 polyphosphate kinase 2 family protein [Atlanticothrix silvestris CENA357]